MHQPPTYTTWKITCHSPEEAEALRQWLSSRTDLNRVLTDTTRVTPDGVEQVQTVDHRLGDYFTAICLLPDAQADPASFRLVFQRRPDAGRFGKDLMVNLLQEIETSPERPSIALDSKGETAPDSADAGPFQGGEKRTIPAGQGAQRETESQEPGSNATSGF